MLKGANLKGGGGRRPSAPYWPAATVSDYQFWKHSCDASYFLETVM